MGVVLIKEKNWQLCTSLKRVIYSVNNVFTIFLLVKIPGVYMKCTETVFECEFWGDDKYREIHKKMSKVKQNKIETLEGYDF